jgi:hypothetical protein
MPQFPLPLPTNRAFVVQLRAQPSGAPLSWDGRVEHVVSGQVTHFHSLEELVAFISRVLAGVQASARQEAEQCKDAREPQQSREVL